MILPFSTQILGKESFFVEKIHKCFRLKEIYMKAGMCEDFYPNGYNYYVKDKCKAKLHVIIEDKKERWKVGTKIDFFINVRQKNMFRFAPVLPVVSTQKIEIIHTEFINDIIITIDKKRLNTSEMQQLAYNDGFDNLYEFIAYFNEDYVGKIIHWTDKRY
jgi:hypothetical protein